MSRLAVFNFKSFVRFGYISFLTAFLFASIISFWPLSNASAANTPTDYALTAGFQYPSDLVTAAGSMWYISESSSLPYLSNITTSGTITNHSILPVGDLALEFDERSLNVDSTGKLWFAGCVTRSAGISSKQLLLGSMDPVSTVFTYYYYPSSSCLGYPSFDFSVSGSAIDANDNIWVAMHINGYSGYTKLMRFDTSGVQQLTYNSGYSPTGARNWTDFTAGPNNSLWVADKRNDQITQLSLSPSTGAIMSSTNYGLSHTPKYITSGPDGNLWFSNDDGSIGKLTPAGVLSNLALPSGRSVQRFTKGPDGALWFTADNGVLATDAVGRVSSGGSITEYPATEAHASITAGPDNAVWFVEYTSGKIGRLSTQPFISDYALPAGFQQPADIVTTAGSMWYMNKSTTGRSYLSSINTSGVITNYDIVPTGDTALDFNGKSLNIDSTGKLWFAGCVTRASGVASKQLLLGSMDPVSMVLAYHYYPSSKCLGYASFDYDVSGSTIDASDNIWVSMHKNGYSGATKLLRFNTSGAQLSSYGSGYSPVSSPRNWTDLTAGPNNSLWIADGRNNKITQLTLSSSTGSVTAATSYSVPNTPKNITAGSDGNLWFTYNNGSVGKLTPSGVLTNIVITSGRVPQQFNSTSNGTIWMTAAKGSASSNGLVRIDTSGLITEYALGVAASSYPVDITIGPDDIPWYSQNDGKIGKLGY